MLFGQCDGQSRADGGGLPDVLVQLLRRLDIQQHDDAVFVALVEDPLRGQHTLSGADALVLVDRYSHGFSSPLCVVVPLRADVWADQGACGGSTTPSPSGFVVSEAQFNQMFPSRNSFYTY
ncbi:MAG: hypothetical protein QOI83_1428, partial [Streptomycetaceae bacterium]|nr:hypothetical protein [Streptomycetaceae bacterium]